MIKVLNVLNSMNLSQGGPPEVVRNLKRYINKDKKIISVLQYDRLSMIQFIFFFLLKKKKSKLYKFINKYDVIHFHNVWSVKVAILAYFAHKVSVKVIFSSHGYLDTWSMNKSIYKKKAFLYFVMQRLILRSNFFFSNIGEYLDCKKKIKFSNTFVIPNGIETSLYKFDSKKKSEKKKIIFFGRIHEKKGIEILLNAIKELPKDYFNSFYFEITGPGENEYIKKIKNMINKFQLENFVFMLPPKIKKDKLEYLQNADVFILPSYEEGDSIALKEAMAAENAVIISEQCRLDLIIDYKAGFVVKTDKESIKKVLLKLKNCNLDFMAKNSKNIIHEYFNNSDCSDRVLKIYQDIYTGSYNSKDWINN